MGEVVNLPRNQPDIRAATCGCDGQTFILVVDAAGQPDFVYCVQCQRRMASVRWQWIEAPKSAA